VFEGDSADTCAGKFPLVSMGGLANGQACADGERGPPSARAEFLCLSEQMNRDEVLWFRIQILSSLTMSCSSQISKLLN
jgi:hypothetical protein